MSASTADDVQELDAREIEGEPFSDIQDALRTLPAGETLVLVNSFEPEPLYDVLEQRGFEYETTQVAADEWRVSITHA
ncbi:Uncharacterized conserved protein [Haloplanus vescus]|uniref:Uncharacterized conserved protein n=1 Tax=Haloplanus vescus TaxID=555874 RepID=A0A1H3W8K0_9EURY|nr:DUF2249 domain-containing protein [Haloplanus vescus]SDZ83423.1 Uncharacterized conserved protein [Haloplanus vescus]